MSDVRYKVGDKLKKNSTSLNTCYIEDKNNLEYIIVSEVHEGSQALGYEAYDANDNPLGHCSCFRHQDLEYYSNGDPTVPKRTFKLLKDTHIFKKGALVQEEGDEQPYSVITPEFAKTEGKAEMRIIERSLVEEQPAWFVEVFAVSPQYMTQSELDQFESFKTSLTKKKATKK